MPRLAAAVVLACLAAGCATPPSAPSAVRGPPPLTAAPDVAPNFAVPSIRERMVHLALQEWTLFGRPEAVRRGDGELALEFPPGVAATHEVQPASLARVLLYWYAVSRMPIVGYEGELRPWSAAFVSWLARSAGLTAEEFPPSVAHWDYIERFLRGGDDARFAARDPAAYAPRVGDLVCASRGSLREFAALQRGPYHCDLVVEAAAGEVRAIGGNVADAVALTRIEIDERGLLRPTPERPWVAVIEQRDTR